ncbi:hypothetical protein CLOM_g18889 [Closterium sp. NIES-68]|nr:hypothetical protein CLOM_g18889 [Closterium sp. NIES-68]GJP68251.1 hypothetical protein CLOP_g24976 [Closterium sp. NIES-67]
MDVDDLPTGANYSRWTILSRGMPGNMSLIAANGSEYNVPDDYETVVNNASKNGEDVVDLSTISGYSFNTQAYTHLLVHTLYINLIQVMKSVVGERLQSLQALEISDLNLQCFTNAQDPFTFMPTIRIAFVRTDTDPMRNDTSIPLKATRLTNDFYIKPEGYIARLSDTSFCLLVSPLNEGTDGNSYRTKSIIAEPALFDKYIHLNYSSTTDYAHVGWIDAPGCAASSKPTFLPVPPPPPGPAPASPSNAVHALSALVSVLASSLCLVALLLLS